jgi:hypothetical protein
MIFTQNILRKMILLTGPYVEIELGWVVKSKQSLHKPARPNAVPAAMMSFPKNEMKKLPMNALVKHETMQ